MPRWKQLPNGKWVAVPSVDSYADHFSKPGLYSDEYWTSLAGRDDEDKSGGTLFGSFLEGVKSIPSGAADVFLSGAQAAIGVATPWGDLPIERRLREMASKRARERDPAYRDAFLPAVGTGMGQVGVLGGLSALGPGGRAAGMAAGVGMGISDQTRRIAEYEQRTGENVPWYRESAAHILGAAIGLTEVWPVQKFLLPKSIRKMGDDIVAGVAPRSIESLLMTATAEATQEASAQWMQAMSAKGLYDPEATKDLASAMAEDFKVGGVVGGMADLVAKSIIGRHTRGGSTAKTKAALDAELRRADHRYLNSSAGREVADAADQTSLTTEIGQILKDNGVDRRMGEDILSMYHGRWAVLPSRMENFLIDGGVDAEFVAELRDEFIARNTQASGQLGRLAEAAIQAGDPAARKRYQDALEALQSLTTARVGKLDRALETIGYGARRIGGLSESSQYRTAKKAQIAAADNQNLFTFQQARKDAKAKGEPVPSYFTFIKGLLGGDFGAGGYFRAAEVLGTHAGPGTSAVDRRQADEDGSLPDYSLGASEHASYDLTEISEVIWSDDIISGSENFTRVAGLTYNENYKADIIALDRQIKEFEKRNEDAYQEHPIFREQVVDESLSDDQWSKRRDQNSQALMLARGENNAQLAELRRQRNIAYLKLLSERLTYLNSVFYPTREVVTPEAVTAREEAAGRLRMDDAQFREWLAETQEVVGRNQKKSEYAQAQAAQARENLERQVRDLSPEETFNMRAKFLPQIRAGFLEFPRDISATNSANLARLFSTNVEQTTANLDTMFETRAHADISDWLIRYGVQRPRDSGIPYLDRSAPVVRKFLDSQKPDEEAIAIVEKHAKKIGKSREELTKDEVDDAFRKKFAAPMSADIDVQMAAVRQINEMTDRYNYDKPQIKESDIVELLKSKNILLRGDTPDSDKAVEGNIGSALADKTKTGVNSRPFQMLLTDMTGARSWEEAGYSERLLMYSRLLQLAPHREVKKTNRQGDPPGRGEDADHRSIYLPNFYEDPSLNAHIDTILGEIIEPGGVLERRNVTKRLFFETLEGDATVQSGLMAKTKDLLGDEFDGTQFNEAMATLIESGVLIHGKTDPKDVVSTEIEQSSDETIEQGMPFLTVNGELGTPSNPIPLQSDISGTVPNGAERTILTPTQWMNRFIEERAGEPSEGTKIKVEYRPEFKHLSPIEMIRRGIKKSLMMDKLMVERLSPGTVITLSDPPFGDVTVRITTEGQPLSWDFEETEAIRGTRLWDMIKSIGPVAFAGSNEVQLAATEAIDVLNKGTKFEKWTPKEQAKTRIASQFIGEGAEGSATDNYRTMYESINPGVANSGAYTFEDVVFVASNGKRRGRISPVDAEGNLQGAYRNVEAAIQARSTIVMDDQAHLRATGDYNIGEAALARYLRDRGYKRLPDTPPPEAGPAFTEAWSNGTTGVWVPMESAVEWSERTGETAKNFETYRKNISREVGFELFDPANEPDVERWMNAVDRYEQAVAYFESTGRTLEIDPRLETPGILPEEDGGGITALASTNPFWQHVTRLSGLKADPLTILKAVIRNDITNLETWAAVGDLETSDQDVNRTAAAISHGIKSSVPSADGWNMLLNQVGLSLKNFPWPFQVDSSRPINGKHEIDLTEQEKQAAIAEYMEEIDAVIPIDSRLRNEDGSLRSEIRISDVAAARKFAPLADQIFSTHQLPVIFAPTYEGATAYNSGTHIVIDATKVDSSYTNKWWTRMSIRDRQLTEQDEYIEKLENIPREFASVDEFMMFIISHEKAHSVVPPADAGITWIPGSGYKGSTGSLAYSQYEDIVSAIGLLEMDSFMFEQVRQKFKQRQKEINDSPPPEYDGEHVSLNVNYKRLLDQHTSDEQAALRGTPEQQESDQERYEKETRPERVQALLESENLDKPIKKLLDEYNRSNPDQKPLTKREYVDRFASHIQSAAGIEQLSDMGLLETVGEKLKTVADRVPVDTILELETPDGRTIIKSLMASGALPASLSKTTSALRTEYLSTVQDRFEVLQKNVDRVLKKMRVPDNVKVQFVSDLDHMFQVVSDVGVAGRLVEGRHAVYDAPGNRIIINLTNVDPDNMKGAQEIMKDVAFHEGLHSLLMRDVLTGEELRVLNNYIRNNVVPKEVDAGANGENLTWYERAVYRHRNTNLTEGDMEHEAIISLMESLVKNEVPDAISAGKVRKIKKGLSGLIEGMIGAAKESDITDVVKILAGIEQGRIGERGSGFMGDTEFTDDHEIRSTRLSRYADPKELAELERAVGLRDAAKTDEMRAIEQAKVDEIADRIVARRTAIQDSAPPDPDDAEAMQNKRELDQTIVEGTNPLNIPLYGNLDPSGRGVKEAINEAMRIRRGEQGYVMPAEYQYFFNNRAPRSSSSAVDLVEEGVKAGAISHVEGDPVRKALKDGPLSDKALSQKELDEPLGKSSVDGFRYQYLDRRQWVVGQTDRILAARDRAQLDAETSALVMWRNADNALNWLPSLMTRGPLSYLGVGTGMGEFDNTPVYDDKLQEKYGGNGRVLGLNDIFSFIIEPKDNEVATLYGVAKRIKWTKKRLDEVKRMTGGVPIEQLSPELRREYNRFNDAYEKINPKNKFKDAYLNKIIQEIEGNDRNSHIIEFWDNYQAFNRQMIQMSYDTGMITREQYNEWMSMDYAPFYRDVSPIESFPVGTQQGMQQRGRNLVEQALEGSKDPISTDLMNSILENTQALVRDAMMNVAASRTARDSLELGEGRKIDISNLAAAVDNRVIRVMENGVPTFYELDDAELAMSTMMLGFNPKKRLQELFGGQKLGRGMSKALTSTSSWLRESVTRTPAFQVKNIFRDSWNAMILTGGGPGLLLDSMRNAIRPDSLRRAEEAGLSIGIDFIAEPGQYGRKMRSELQKKNPDWTNPLTPVRVAWDFLGRIAKQSEIATRVAVYDRVLAKTGDRALAQYLAVEIMNYGRRGANPALSTYMSTVPFMNGRMQGLDVTLGVLGVTRRGASDIPGTFAYGMTKTEYENAPLWQKHRAQMFSRGLLLSAATGLMYMLMRDDEEWQDLRDETKADNWLLPMSDHAWLKIPIPFEVGVLFKVIPEKLMEAAMEKDVDYRDVGSEVVRQLRTSLSIGAPQLVAPIANAMRNYDTFRKDAIVSPWMEEGLDPNEQRNRYTSNVARSVSDLVNDIPLVNNLTFLTSPMKMEYMMRQYLGTMGGYVMVAADRVARTGVIPTIPYDPLMNWSEAENIVGTNVDFDLNSFVGGEGIANVPLLGDLLTDPRTRAGRQQDFYETINELDEVVATLSSITERDRQKGFEYRRKHQAILNNKEYLRYMARQMKNWRDQRDRLADVPRELMSDDEKREYYQRLLKRRTSRLSGITRIAGDLRDARSPLRWFDED
tara:strand:+ start:1454 stop:11566 length:10113 start_codon:yes stop_codon:yes gene_type:complete